MKRILQKWEQYEMDFIEEVYHELPCAVIAAKLERSPAAIQQRAAFMGIRKYRVYRKREAA